MDKGNEYYRRFLQGDSQALGVLVSLYNERLVLFLNGYVKNFTVAEDLAADTFLQLLVKKPSFREDSAVKTWLFRIAGNKAIDYLRRQRRYPEISLEDENFDLSTGDLPEMQVLQEEKMSKLYAALQTLPDNYRTVLQLLYFEEMSYKQAAVVLHKSEKQIKNDAYRARQALKIACQKEGIENAFE